MKSDEIVALLSWLSKEALEGAENNSVFKDFCDRCRQAGLAISHCVAVIDTLHPEGSAFEWSSAAAVDKPEQKYQSTKEIWETSAFNNLLATSDVELRRQLAKGAPLDFHRLAELKAEGHTDYLATIHRFSERGSIGDMTAVYSAWATGAEDGFCLPRRLPRKANGFRNDLGKLQKK